METTLADLKPLRVRYTNWKRVTRIRTILIDPRTTNGHLWFGATQWHPEEQWLLHAYDPEDCQWKYFALTQCDFNIPQVD
jgi:hypothetical protein